MSATGAERLRECVNTEFVYNKLEFKRGSAKAAVSRAVRLRVSAQRASTVVDFLYSGKLSAWKFRKRRKYGAGVIN